MLHTLSIGDSIDIDQSQGFKLLIISILLENPELFKVISDSFQMEINDNNLDHYIQLLMHLYQFSPSTQYYNYNNIIDYISGNFHLIDKSKLLPLPKSILFLIISNDKLKLYNEDSLFDFVQQIFETDENDSEFDKNDFLEKINFLRLSKEKLNDAFNSIEFNTARRELFEKLMRCSQYHEDVVLDEDMTRYVHKKLIFLPNEDISSPLNGIIRHLTNIAGGNVHDKGFVDVSSSLYANEDCHGKFACQLDELNYFHSQEIPNCYLQYDFKERRVHPTHYAIRCRHDYDGLILYQGMNSGSNPRDWIIEASNTGQEGDWKKLDERKKDPSFRIRNTTEIFYIREKLDPNECFRFLRIQNNGKSSDDRDFLIICAFEIYGDLYDL